MSNIYFTSDTHFGHANIASKSTSKWKEGFRDYPSLHEMNKDLVNNINKTVLPDDTLYHLGDWSFGGIDNIWKFRKQINCRNIHLILGNHDHHIEENKILPNCYEPDHSPGFFMDGPPDPLNLNLEVQARELFSSVGHYKEVIINGRVFVLCHYAFRVWHGSHKGWINLYGHSHDTLDCDRKTGKLNEYGKSMDVSVDSAYRILGERRPFAINEIDQILSKRNIHFADHHDSKTNTGKPQGSKRR